MSVSNPFSISYVLCTRNRLPYLNLLFDLLLNHLNEDEELVVIDGNSTDGSREFLEGKFKQGQIHQFISEPDRNQAEGWNKGFLAARGSFIKKIMDDDVFSLHRIRQMRDYMNKYPQVEACISDVIHASVRASSIASRFKEFQEWQNGRTPCFTFSDISLLLRRSSLSKCGLYDPQFKMLDWEFSLRMSFNRLKIAYLKGVSCLAVATEGNVTSGLDLETAKREEQIGKIKYGYPGDQSGISLWSRFKIELGKLLKAKEGASSADISLEELYKEYYRLLQEQIAKEAKPEFSSA